MPEAVGSADLVYPRWPMDTAISAAWFAGLLFLGLLLFLEIGRRVGLRRLQREGSTTAFGPVESAIFALFGLLIAFTFSGGIERFNSRRTLIADEANAIGTAYLRLDLLGDADRTALQQQFRAYLDSRLEVYRKLPDLEAALTELARSSELQSGIWTSALAGLRRPDVQLSATMLLIPALNEMFDITTTRTMAARIHPPVVVYGLLFLLGLCCAVLAGHSMAGMKDWSWLHALAFALAVALVVYVILEIEYPRTGFIRLTAFDQARIDLRDSMK
jgi:hypothetical protein